MGLKDVVYRVGRTSAHVQTLKLRTYLEQSGWVRSRIEGSCVTAAGRPRAWLALPALNLLELRVRAGSRVFEWGSGASTQWWRELGCEVTSCEHDPGWAARDPQIIYRPVDDGYVQEIAQHGLFDIVLVDGRRRAECIRLAVEHLTSGGVIILDNSDRTRYSSAVDHLTAQGFRFLPLVGIAPGSTKQQTTGIFYRDGNVLEL